MNDENKNILIKEINKNNAPLSEQTYPENLILLPIPISLKIIFPTMMFPFEIDDENNTKLIEESIQSFGNNIGIVPDLEINEEHIENKLFHVGVVSKIIKNPHNNHSFLFQAMTRFKINKIVKTKPFIVANVTYHKPKTEKNNDLLKSYISALVSKVKELIQLNPIFSEEIQFFVSKYGVRDPHALSDTVSSMLTNPSTKDFLTLLETFNISKRIPILLKFIQKEIEISTIKEKINKEIEKKISKQQREHLLHEQLNQIKKELGMEKDDKSEEIKKFIDKIKKLSLSEEAKKVTEEELSKLKMYDTRSSEYAVSRNYLQWIIDIPWKTYTKDILDIKKIKNTLNREHYGMDDVKERILEFVAIQKLKKSTLGTVILLVGPPGVGKTTLAKSIATALGRKSYNFSLGAMRDEAELKGHRRTYIGALPGKMVQALKVSKSSNPVIILDEIDKMNVSYKGDPSSALLEILDPEQNDLFLDHYLDLRIDLSKVLFIATANQLDTVSAPILDRMEIIQLNGYSTEEKIVIANKYIIPKVYKEMGLNQKKLDFSDRAVESIIQRYARESGVRSLQKMIQKIMRKVALELVNKKRSKLLYIKENTLIKYLGLERFKIDRIYDEVQPGIITGLAWTSVGGSTLYIESKVYQSDSSAELKLTGRLGETMKESAQIAYSYIQSIEKKYKINDQFFKTSKIHLHVPEGATPKDGPSAGITMALSLFSLAINKIVPTNIAMTGELTISGKVLPIGGVKEKIMAGKRVDKKILIFPIENKKDVDELPKVTTKSIKIRYISTFEELIHMIYPNL